MIARYNEEAETELLKIFTNNQPVFQEFLESTKPEYFSDMNRILFTALKNMDSKNFSFEEKKMILINKDYEQYFDFDVNDSSKYPFIVYDNRIFYIIFIDTISNQLKFVKYDGVNWETKIIDILLKIFKFK